VLMAQYIGKPVGPALRENSAPPHDINTGNTAASLDIGASVDPDRPGSPSGISCPECRGTLFELHENGYIRFRCRVGHIWSLVSLLASQDSSTENALWVALENLDEKIALCHRMANMARQRGNPLTAKHYEASAEETPVLSPSYHQRRTPVHRRGARDHRRTPVLQRGTGDDERGTAVHQRRVPVDQ
jgi:two-component system chemotaxis response regulator CheB